MENNRILADYHTHTVYSHGKGTVRDNVIFARNKGLKTIAITDHGLHHFIFGVSERSLIEQAKEIRALREEFPDMTILHGVEADLKGLSGRIDVPESDVDILLCGFHKPVWGDRFSDYYKLFYNSYSHYLYKPTAGQIARNTKAYINMIRDNKVDIITHPNYHLALNMREVASCAADYGTVLEISSRHDDLTEDDFIAIDKSGVMLAVNSDAHKPEKIGECSQALKNIEKHEISNNRVINYLNNYKFRSNS